MTSGVSSEFGRFSGGVINAVTKRGGNAFSGSFRVDYTNPAWRDENPLERCEAPGQNPATCVPSRAMVLSGRPLFRIDEKLLRDETWPAAFGRAGYLTFLSGKWHNGEDPDTPEYRAAFSEAFKAMPEPDSITVDPHKLEDALKANPDAKLVAFVHAETSTGAQVWTEVYERKGGRSLAGVLGVLFGAVLSSKLATSAAAVAPTISVRDLGNLLMGPHAAAVLIVGVILTVTLIGAVIIASTDRADTGKDES